jgi:hypothetical protein
MKTKHNTYRIKLSMMNQCLWVKGIFITKEEIMSFSNYNV